jgi:hypothetical protein
MTEGSLLVASLWVLLAACHAQIQEAAPADAEDGTHRREAVALPSPTKCSQLTEQACTASEPCVPITDAVGVYRGCGPRDVGWKEVETCASNGKVALFPDSCIPGLQAASLRGVWGRDPLMFCASLRYCELARGLL